MIGYRSLRVRARRVQFASMGFLERVRSVSIRLLKGYLTLGWRTFPPPNWIRRLVISDEGECGHPSTYPDTLEADAILNGEMAKYQNLELAELENLLEKQDTYEVVGDSGATYQLELQAVWDSKRKRIIRVIGCIDSGGRSARTPQTKDFLIGPSGLID